MLKAIARLTYRLWARYRYRHVLKAIVGDGGLVVQDGPFANMVYVPCAVEMASRWSLGSALAPKLLGCYEAELHSILAYVLETGYDEVVNIGCGEGYYAVGLALRLPGARVLAFEANPLLGYLCAELAHANHVASRVAVAGKCDIDRLRMLRLERALIVCDCEGYEVDLLQPDLVPGLTMCDILVELHDFIDPDVSPTVLSRFASTHIIALINSTRRDPATYPALRTLNAIDQRLAVDEFRPGAMQWAFITTGLTRGFLKRRGTWLTAFSPITYQKTAEVSTGSNGSGRMPVRRGATCTPKTHRRHNGRCSREKKRPG